MARFAPPKAITALMSGTWAAASFAAASGNGGAGCQAASRQAAAKADLLE